MGCFGPICVDLLAHLLLLRIRHRFFEEGYCTVLLSTTALSFPFLSFFPQSTLLSLFTQQHLFPKKPTCLCFISTSIHRIACVSLYLYCVSIESTASCASISTVGPILGFRLLPRISLFAIPPTIPYCYKYIP